MRFLLLGLLALALACGIMMLPIFYSAATFERSEPLQAVILIISATVLVISILLAITGMRRQISRLRGTQILSPQYSPWVFLLVSCVLLGLSYLTFGIFMTTHAANKAIAESNIEGELPAPILILPANNARLDTWPRELDLKWQILPGAEFYMVEIDCKHCCGRDLWCAESAKEQYIIRDSETNNFKSGFPGVNPGRWRVWAIDQTGKRSKRSDWHHFQFVK